MRAVGPSNTNLAPEACLAWYKNGSAIWARRPVTPGMRTVAPPSTLVVRRPVYPGMSLVAPSNTLLYETLITGPGSESPLPSRPLETSDSHRQKHLKIGTEFCTRKGSRSPACRIVMGRITKNLFEPIPNQSINLQRTDSFWGLKSLKSPF